MENIKGKELISIVEDLLADTEKNYENLPDEIKNLHGCSGWKYTC